MILFEETLLARILFIIHHVLLIHWVLFDLVLLLICLVLAIPLLFWVGIACTLAGHYLTSPIIRWGLRLVGTYGLDDTASLLVMPASREE